MRLKENFMFNVTPEVFYSNIYIMYIIFSLLYKNRSL